MSAFYGQTEKERQEAQRLDKINQLRKTIRYIMVEINQVLSTCQDEEVNKTLHQIITNNRMVYY